MNTCPVEISPDCPGHKWWEKLSNCLISALYLATPDETTGNVDGFEIHVSLFIQEEAETIDACAYPETVKVTIPAGTYCLLIENSQGHVTMLDYDTADKAQAAFDLWDEQYSAWLEAVDARACHHIEYGKDRSMSTPEPVGFPLWNWADPTTHDVFKDALASMPRIVAIPIESGRDMARGYAWGRIDSPGYVWPTHGGDGLDFTMAYAIHLASSKHIQAVREAFNEWHSTGRIG